MIFQSWINHLYNIHCGRIIFCLEIFFSRAPYHIEANQLVCKANQLTGFYLIWVFTERYFRIDYIYSRINVLNLFTSLSTALNYIILIKFSCIQFNSTKVKAHFRTITIASSSSDKLSFKSLRWLHWLCFIL